MILKLKSKKISYLVCLYHLFSFLLILNFNFNHLDQSYLAKIWQLKSPSLCLVHLVHCSKGGGIIILSCAHSGLKSCYYIFPCTFNEMNCNMYFLLTGSKMNVSIYIHCTGNSCKKRSVKVHGVWGEVVRFPDLLWKEDIH